MEFTPMKADDVGAFRRKYLEPQIERMAALLAGSVLAAPNIKEPQSMTRRIAISAIALAAGCAIGAGLGLILAAPVL